MVTLCVLTAVLFPSYVSTVKDEPLVNLSEWERGIAVTSPHQEDMTVFLWFYEWNMFDALQKGQHTHGTSENEINVSQDQRSGSVVSSPLGLSLEMQAGVDSADMTLTVTNKSGSRLATAGVHYSLFQPRTGGEPECAVPEYEDVFSGTGKSLSPGGP